MRFAVRALNLFLAAWLTVAASFPPCCWSMTYAHQHQEAPDSSRSGASAAGHHHHGSDESVAVAGTPSVLSSIPAYSCDAWSADAATITSAGKPAADARLACETASDALVRSLPAHFAARVDLSPPGASSRAAFLNPLRI